MRLVRAIAAMRREAKGLRRRGTVGLVPTMGALHDGHLALIKESVSRCDRTIVSVFVNPLQFGPREDFRVYPRQLAKDIRLARSCGADVVFAPSAADMYPPGHSTHVASVALARRWEGRSRPGHFEGVATVVAKLLMIMDPSLAVFGQKDYQQWRVVQQLVRDLHLPVALRMVPTVREADGLAMSSRNAALSARQRAQAPVLYKALSEARQQILAGERRAAPLLGRMRRRIAAEPGVRLDYVGIAETDRLVPISRLRGKAVLLGAVRLGRTRLIDNLLVRV